MQIGAGLDAIDRGRPASALDRSLDLDGPVPLQERDLRPDRVLRDVELRRKLFDRLRLLEQQPDDPVPPFG